MAFDDEEEAESCAEDKDLLLPRGSLDSASIFSHSSIIRLQMSHISLKPEQHSSTEAVFNGHNVFVWLPTGYGKSLCYQALPFMMDSP